MMVNLWIVLVVALIAIPLVFAFGRAWGWILGWRAACATIGVRMSTKRFTSANRALWDVAIGIVARTARAKDPRISMREAREAHELAELEARESRNRKRSIEVDGSDLNEALRNAGSKFAQ